MKEPRTPTAAEQATLDAYSQAMSSTALMDEVQVAPGIPVDKSRGYSVTVDPVLSEACPEQMSFQTHARTRAYRRTLGDMYWKLIKLDWKAAKEAGYRPAAVGEAVLYTVMHYCQFVWCRVTTPFLPKGVR